MNKVTVIIYQHCEDDGARILGVTDRSQAAAKSMALESLSDDNTYTRIVAKRERLVVEERFMDGDYPDGFTPWMESGELFLEAHTVK